MATATPIAAPDPAATMEKPEKKSKKDKSAKHDKKRAREEDAADAERRHKRSKSVTETTLEIRPAEVYNDGGEEKKKKKKKDKKTKLEEGGEEQNGAAPEEKAAKKKHKKKHADAAAVDDAQVVDAQDEKPKKKHKKKDVQDEATEEPAKSERKKKKSKKLDSESTILPPQSAPEDLDSIDVEQPTATFSSKKSSKVYQPPDIPAAPQFPFFTQTVSLYEPIYPVGWAQPVTNSQQQHLKHLQNRYVPSLRGVLMDYKNVSLGAAPGRAGAATTDDEPCTVLSHKEFAVGFGWITADVDLFVPSRGAWMEGSVNLQTEGHIGVVCFGKFNASIEARRLPPSWRWVPSDISDAQSSGFDETASLITADDHGVVRQVHSTGFWADGDGEKVKGRIRFRIRNFDVGTSGETSYLSLEGTMLDRVGEKAVVAEEARAAKSRKESKGGARRTKKRAPEFSMTRFEDEAEAAAPEQETEQGKMELHQADNPEETEAEAEVPEDEAEAAEDE